MEMSFDFSAFQKNLRHLIDSHGLTVKGLAGEVNISHITISRYLNGHREPDGAAGRFKEALAQIISAQRQDTKAEG